MSPTCTASGSIPLETVSSPAFSRLPIATPFWITIPFSAATHVAVEGELRSHEYQREISVDAQTTSIPQRVWDIRLDSVLKLDRAAKGASNDDSHAEEPR